MMLNIPRTVTDPYYRYKREVLNVKPLGHTKTCLQNLVEISIALKVPTQYILKYMGHELGCKVNFDECTLSGHPEEQKINKCLDKFIDQYVLCAKCRYPEVFLELKKKDIVKVCNACGANSMIKNGHKLNDYIVKNFVPPEQLAERRTNDPNSDLTQAFPVNGASNDDGEEGEESKHEEEKASADHHEPFSNLEKELLRKTKVYYDAYEKFSQDDAAYDEIVNNVKKDVPVSYQNKIPYLLFNSMFDINIMKEIPKNEALLKKIYESFKQCDPQLDLLLNLENFVYVKNNGGGFEKYVPTMLKMFYDVDLFDEDFIKDWDDGKLRGRLMMDFRYQNSVDEKFRKAAQEFTAWIRSAEEDEGDDE